MLYGSYRLGVRWGMFGGRGILTDLIAKFTQTSRRQERLRQEMNQIKNQRLFEEMLKQQQQPEIPLTFVEVDPAAVAAQPPKNPKFYSTHDTVAVNPEPNRESQPKIEGKQTKLARLFDNPKPQPKPEPQPLQPTFPKQPQPPSAATAPKETESTQVRDDAKSDAKSEPARPLENLAARTFEKTPEPPDLKPPGGDSIGDLALATPQKVTLPNKATGAGAPVSANPLIAEPSPPQQRQRPRTLAQAYAQNPSLAGRTMQQDGGVSRPGRIVSVDAKGSLFGVYDAAFIAAVEERWYQLIDSYRDNRGVLRQGKVVLDFKLRFDGRITDLGVHEKTVDEILGVLCQRAVLDPAPFARWPAAMRQMIGTDQREVRFTFYYE